MIKEVRLISRYQIGWFSTGRDKAARDLLTTVHHSIGQGEIEAEIAFIFCSREAGEATESDRFIRLAEEYRIPLICFSYQKFKASGSSLITAQTAGLPSWRFDYDREVMKRLTSFSPDICVLAGYMLIVGEEMCQRYNMINLHPAAPGGPTGTWQEVIWQLIDGRAEETGVMMHLVTPELDKGPPVAYCTFPIRGEAFDKYWQEIKNLPANSQEEQPAKNSLFRLIREYGLAREFPLILATIKAFGQGKIKITKERRVVDAKENLISGYNLTGEINEAIKNERI